MRVFTILTAFTMLLVCVFGCGQNQPATAAQPNPTEQQTTQPATAAQPNPTEQQTTQPATAAQPNATEQQTTQPGQPSTLWKLCCMSPNTTNIHGCVPRTDADARNPFQYCPNTMDQMVMFMTCLEYSVPCKITHMYGQLLVRYNGLVYNGEMTSNSAELIIMLNRVDRSKFFVKTREQMRNAMSDNKSQNPGENNYWIGLNTLASLKNLDIKVSLKLYVNTTQFFTGRYDVFQVGDNDYKLSLDKFAGPTEANMFTNIRRGPMWSPIGMTFKGIDDLQLGFCTDNKYATPTAWWYAVYASGSIPSLCSESVLTTDDGTNGWGRDPIKGAIMSIKIKNN